MGSMNELLGLIYFCLENHCFETLNPCVFGWAVSYIGRNCRLASANIAHRLGTNGRKWTKIRQDDT